MPITNIDSQDSHQTPDSRVRGQRVKGRAEGRIFKLFPGDSYAHGSMSFPEQVVSNDSIHT